MCVAAFSAFYLRTLTAAQPPISEEDSVRKKKAVPGQRMKSAVALQATAEVGWGSIASFGHGSATSDLPINGHSQRLHCSGWLQLHWPLARFRQGWCRLDSWKGRRCVDDACSLKDTMHAVTAGVNYHFWNAKVCRRLSERRLQRRKGIHRHRRTDTTELGHSRHFGGAPATSGHLRSADILRIRSASFKDADGRHSGMPAFLLFWKRAE